MPPTETKTVLRYATNDERLVRRRRRIIRSLFILLVATLALAICIIVMGDIRRHKVAMTAAQAYVDQVSGRVGQQRQLPLNLGLRDDTPPEASPVPLRNIEWLTRDQAWLLRRSERRVIAAHSLPIRRRFLEDGCVAVFFEGGRFNLEWMLLPDFDTAQRLQIEEIEHLEHELRKGEPSAAEGAGLP